MVAILKSYNLKVEINFFRSIVRTFVDAITHQMRTSQFFLENLPFAFDSDFLTNFLLY